jgi:hypothetical protein
MKRRISINIIFIGLIAFITSVNMANAQENKTDKKEQKTEEIQKLINSKSFAFVAQYATPLSGRQINLTSPYDLRVSPDTLIAELPYFGRVYNAPIDPTEGGIHFTSTNFSYKVNNRKKGGWDITILPKNANDVKQMYLSVSSDGYANLQVFSNNRQGIGFNGYITDKRYIR